MIFLGIDCGTQSTKTIALDDASGAVLASASKSHGLIPGLPPGHLEQDPALWVDALEETVQQVIASLGARKTEIGGMGISGQQHGFVPLDKDGRVIRPAKLWCDTSTHPECEQARQHFGGKKAVIDLIGNDMLPGFTAPKILWLKQHEPAHFARLEKVLLPHDYLNYYLTGEYRMEYGDASGTALMDVRRRQWSRPILEFIDPALESKLPPLESSRKPAGTLRSDIAKRWGLSSSIIVSAGGGDNMMGAIGTGNVRPGNVTASLGTSGTIYAYSDKPVIDPDGEIAAFCDSTDAWLPLLCTMNVTVATEAIRQVFSWNVVQLDQAVESVPAGAGGLLFLPYLQGERTPNLPNGCGVLHGMNLQNMTPAYFARAAMEGVTLGMAYGLRKLETLGVKAREIRVIGGGSKSVVWRQICADVFGCPVVTMQSAEGAALGGAIQSLAAVRTEKSIAAWADALVLSKSAEKTEPSAHAGIYQSLLEAQTKLARQIF